MPENLPHIQASQKATVSSIPKSILLMVNTRMWGGAEIFLWRMTRELLGMGIHVVVMCPPNSIAGSKFRQLAGAVCYEVQMGTASGRWRGLGSVCVMFSRKRMVAQAIRDLRSKHDIDSFICQYPREQTLWTRETCTKGLRIFWLIHSVPHYCLERVIVHPMLKKEMKHAARAFVISETTVRKLMSVGFAKDNMRAIRAGIDVDDTASDVVRASVPTILVVSRLVKNKGIQYVLRAFREILGDYPAARLLVAGEGRYRGSLERLAKDLNVSHATEFLGFVDPRDLYRRGWVLAHATRDRGESMPANILEAGSVGVPTVATRCGGIPEIVVNGETGFLVEPGDEATFALRLRQLIEDEELRRRLSCNAAEYIGMGFSIGAVTRDLIDSMSSAGTDIAAGALV